MSPALNACTSTVRQPGRAATPTTSVSTWRIGCRWMSSSLSATPSSSSCRDPRVVARQLLQPPVAQAIDAAVADVDQGRRWSPSTQQRPPPSCPCRRSRASRAASRMRALAARTASSSVAGSTAACVVTMASAIVVDGQRRRHLAGVVPAHAVGHHEQRRPPCRPGTHLRWSHAARRRSRRAASIIARHRRRSIDALVLYTPTVATSTVQAALARAASALERGRGTEAVQILQPLSPVRHAVPRRRAGRSAIAHRRGLPAGRTTSHRRPLTLGRAARHLEGVAAGRHAVDALAPARPADVRARRAVARDRPPHARAEVRRAGPRFAR